MTRLLRYISAAVLLTCFWTTATAQVQVGDVTITGSIQSDILLPQEDTKIGAEKYDEWALTNSYAEVSAMSQYVDAGVRLEFMRFPMPGFAEQNPDFKGWGVPYFYIKGKLAGQELTLGHYYEQFGSGLILRTYEERSLGIDNSLLGGRLVLRPVEGVQIKVLSGKQRRYWDRNNAWVSGADLELSIDQWSKAMQQSGTFLTLGASFVNKHEKEDELLVPHDGGTYQLHQPQNVNAFDVRARLQKGNWNVLAEYAQKSQDPSQVNGYTFQRGTAALLSASYSKRGMSALVQAKRSENMDFRSRRRETLPLASHINYLPPFTLDHTYTLAALYTYGTQLDGEWAYQAELGYDFKRGTALGGKYGTNVKLNFSHIHSLENSRKPAAEGSDGNKSAFWKWGSDVYYQDLNIQVEKKLSSAFKLNLMYMNQFYNQTIMEGHGGLIHSNIFVAEGKYRFNKKFTLRGELQYLTTAGDQGDWAFALAELSMLPHWMFTLSDQWNCGETKTHYYQGSVTFTAGTHRLQLGYGRTRAGYNCTGGVCRYVPASKGVTLSYNYNF